ncbi:MAG: hypothetical protein EAY81_09860 [Bacteroidetes bacterium]|nr:MAG: hypothetical protein EAY81_09860 [Bacteroidota bacterium]
MKHLLSLSFVALLLTSCSNSIVQVYDYYILNGVEQRPDSAVASSSSSRLLFRDQESASKAQFELVAYKKDTLKYLIFGSHAIGKSAKINNEQYHFKITDVYSSISDKEDAKQLGDMSITFAHVDALTIQQLIDNLVELKARFAAAKVAKGEVVNIEYNLSKEVVLSWQKKYVSDRPGVCYIWVNNRKNSIHMVDFEQALKAFVAY